MSTSGGFAFGLVILAALQSVSHSSFSPLEAAEATGLAGDLVAILTVVGFHAGLEGAVKARLSVLL